MRTRWMAAVLLGAFASLYPEEGEARPYFSLWSQETAAPAGEVSVLVRAVGIRQFEFRLYRVRDPRAFFLKLGDPNAFPPQHRRLCQPRTPIEKLAAWKNRLRTRVRNLARMQSSAANRSRIRAWMPRDRRRPSTPAGAAPSFAAVPLLNPDQLDKHWTQTVQTRSRWDAAEVTVPLPAGAEAITRDRVIPPEGAPLWWNWWLKRREMRGERVTWFPSAIPEDGFGAIYLFRFTIAGRFRTAPARVEAMYEPGVKAWSGEAAWEVLP